MKIELDDGVVADVPVRELADIIYEYGQDLKGYDPEDLMEPGDDEPFGEFRLQVFPDGGWTIHTGSPQYDTDHRGYWSNEYVPVGISRRAAMEMAKEMIENVE